jgi:hypothetical protein
VFTLSRLLLLTLIATLLMPAQWRIRRAEADDRRPPLDNPNPRRHYLLPDELADSVAGLGGSVVARIPGSGVVATLPAGVSRAELIDPKSKISARILEDPMPVRHFLVEFFPDVEPAERELIVIRTGLVVRSRPDLSPAHLLVEGAFRKVARLAQRDEVAYIFPASEDLVRGEPVYACLNSAAGAAGTGQYIPTVGDGWDGPGLGAASLTYSFEKLTDRLPADTVRQILARAMGEWSKAAQVSFSEGASTRESRNVNILFASWAHGDSYPFDGPGKVLAHTFYPSPSVTEPLAGDMHLDADEAWHQGADIDLFSVVLHELGHALGLGHADSPNAVMYPYYRRVSTLSTADIAAIQTLYAAPGAAVTTPPPATPPTPTPAPVTPPATDDRTPPTVAITSIAASTYTTTRTSLSLAGVAADNVGVTEVRWNTSTGASGVAAGTMAWTTAEIPLLVGYNVITIRAYDAAGNSGWRAIGVTRR